MEHMRREAMAAPTVPAADGRVVGLRLIALLSLLGAFLPLITDGFLPAVRPMMAEFGIGLSRAQLAISAALGGFAVAQLFAGALADRIGRRPVLLGSIALLCAASAGVAFAPSFPMVLAFRFLQGVGAAAGPVLSRAIVRDLCGRLEGARVLGLVAMGLATVPLTVPAINALIAARFGWRATLGTYGAFLVLAMWLVGRDYRETLPVRDPDALSPARLASAALAIARHRPSLGYLLMCIVGYGGLVTWISAAPHLLVTYFGTRPQDFGLYWGVPLVTYAIGGLLSARALRRYTSEAILAAAAYLMVASIPFFVTLKLAAPHSLWVFLAGVSAYTAGWAALQPHAQAAMLEAHGDRAGRVSAIFGFLQMFGGAATGILFGKLHDGTPLAAAGLMGGSALLLQLIRVVLLR